MKRASQLIFLLALVLFLAAIWITAHSWQLLASGGLFLVLGTVLASAAHARAQEDRRRIQASVKGAFRFPTADDIARNVNEAFDNAHKRGAQ
jgi:hypothetical protein